MSGPYAEVIGDPIVQSKSPVIHGFWLEKLGLEGRYERTHVKAEGLADYLAARRNDPDWRGCNVTMPHNNGREPCLRTATSSAHISSSLVKEVARFGGDVSGMVPDAVRDALVAQFRSNLGAGPAAP